MITQYIKALITRYKSSLTDSEYKVITILKQTTFTAVLNTQTRNFT